MLFVLFVVKKRELKTLKSWCGADKSGDKSHFWQGRHLILSAVLFCIGLYGVLARRNAIALLMSVELMLNAVNLNLIAFWRYRLPADPTGQAFAAFVYVVAAAEVAVGLALVITLWRNRGTVIVEDVDELKG